jgi:glucose/mannose transport system substrate-binding protein
VCETLKTAGVVPLATVDQGWILRIMFNEIAMGSMGSQKFNDFITGAAPRDDAAMQAAIDTFAKVMTDYVNPDHASTTLGWTDAADRVRSGQAAMFMHGDWAKGYLVQLGASPGVDFGVVGAPGASDLFWEDVDTFSMPVGAKNSTGGYNFLDTILSVEGQIAFSKKKGSTPMRSDIPRSDLDPLGQSTFDDLTNPATIRTIVRNQNAWDDGFAAFATTMASPTADMTMAKATLLQVYVDNPPLP